MGCGVLNLPGDLPTSYPCHLPRATRDWKDLTMQSSGPEAEHSAVQQVCSLAGAASPPSPKLSPRPQLCRPASPHHFSHTCVHDIICLPPFLRPCYLLLPPIWDELTEDPG